MKISIAEKIFEKYPELEVAVIHAKEINNKEENPEIQSLIKKEIEDKRKTTDPEKVTEIPTIKRWREIYKGFGAKPQEYRNSAEALLKRILKNDLWKINKLVDIYNYISIKYIFTIGGEDVEKMKGDLKLDFADGNEEFIPLGEKENKSPWKGEIVYKDDEGVVCRCWNWREGERTKLTEETKEAIIVIENPLKEQSKMLNEATNEIIRLLKKYCNAKCESFLIIKENREVKIR